MSENPSSRQAQPETSTPNQGSMREGPSHTENDDLEQARERKDCHDCLMPGDYYAPYAFSKFLFDAATLSDSREDAISFFFEVVSRSKITCGRCHARISSPIWNPDEAAMMVDLTQILEYETIKVLTCYLYDQKFLTCPTCNHTAHLARDGRAKPLPS